jgi:hypothetical protein
MGRRPSPKRKRLKNTKENSSLLSIVLKRKPPGSAQAGEANSNQMGTSVVIEMLLKIKEALSKNKLSATGVFVCAIVCVIFAAEPAMSQNPPNTMGNILNNQGIITQGQTGNNTIVGSIPRSIDQPRMEALKRQILSELPKDKPITVMAVMGDSEAINFAVQIHSFLKANGFPLAEEGGISQGVFSGSVKGLGVRDDGKTRTFIVGANLQ